MAGTMDRHLYEVETILVISGLALTNMPPVEKMM